MIISYFSSKPFVVTPHLNSSDEGSQQMVSMGRFRSGVTTYGFMHS